MVAHLAMTTVAHTIHINMLPKETKVGPNPFLMLRLSNTGCPLIRTMPSTKRESWVPKIEKNALFNAVTFANCSKTIAQSTCGVRQT